MREYEYGMTIKELKELVSDIPEKNEHGEDFEVWIETGENLSSPVREVSPLNWRGTGSDILLKSSLS